MIGQGEFAESDMGPCAVSAPPGAQSGEGGGNTRSQGQQRPFTTTDLVHNTKKLMERLTGARARVCGGCRGDGDRRVDQHDDQERCAGILQHQPRMRLI